MCVILHTNFVCVCLDFFNEQPPQHQRVKSVFICTRERTVWQGQMLLPTSKGCCTVYYSEDVIEEQERKRRSVCSFIG